jgi:hypothetical protein
MIADAAKNFDATPRVAMLSFSNFGSVRDERSSMVARAVELLRKRRPDLEVEGEMQANVAVDFTLQQRIFPSTRLTGPANVLIFPNLEAGNVAYKLMRELGGVPAVGPVLLGMARPVTVLERDCTVDNIVHMAALTVVAAQKADGVTSSAGVTLVCVAAELRTALEAGREVAGLATSEEDEREEEAGHQAAGAVGVAGAGVEVGVAGLVREHLEVDGDCAAPAGLVPQQAEHAEAEAAAALVGEDVELVEEGVAAGELDGVAPTEDRVADRSDLVVDAEHDARGRVGEQGAQGDQLALAAWLGVAGLEVDRHRLQQRGVGEGGEGQAEVGHARESLSATLGELEQEDAEQDDAAAGQGDRAEALISEDEAEDDGDRRGQQGDHRHERRAELL